MLEAISVAVGDASMKVPKRVLPLGRSGRLQADFLGPAALIDFPSPWDPWSLTQELAGEAVRAGSFPRAAWMTQGWPHTTRVETKPAKLSAARGQLQQGAGGGCAASTWDPRLWYTPWHSHGFNPPIRTTTRPCLLLSWKYLGFSTALYQFWNDLYTQTEKAPGLSTRS